MTGDQGGRFGPEVRDVELAQWQRGERYKVTIDADDKAFGCFLPDGQYNLTRIQISEGPFLSMAQLSDSFSIGNERIVFVGTWRFGVDSPRYGRMAPVSMMAEDAIREQTEHAIRTQYPTLAGESLIAAIPFPPKMETRLYEVLPYPRYPKYFQHHLW
ncbi:MAG: hypothetical protein ABI856_14280 [Nitrospira sp.]